MNDTETWFNQGSNVDHFVISAATLAAVNTLADELAARSSYTTVHVPTVDFPAWLAALGAKRFYSTTRPRSIHSSAVHRFVQSEHLHRGKSMFVVATHEAPADWVTFPEREGTRHFPFAAVAR